MYLDMYHWVERVRHDLETKAPRHTPVYLSIYLSITVMTLLLGRKVMTKLDGILKSKDITLLTKFSSVAQLCLTLCNPMNPSTPGLPIHHQLLEFTQTCVH